MLSSLLPRLPGTFYPLSREGNEFGVEAPGAGRATGTTINPPMRRRTKATVLTVLIIVLLLVLAALLRKTAPPEAARLLPESDGIIYFNLRPLRAYTHFDRHPVPHDPAYQSFIDATGFEFERDLDQAAFALHRMSNPLGPNGPVAFSEVFIGHINGKRLDNYFASLASAKEEYAGHTIYSIPSQGRTVRVVLLGYDIVAASNAPTPEQIHSIVDRYRTAALPFSGSSLLREHYSEIPLLSLAWGIGKLSLPLKRDGINILGFNIPVALDTTFLASLRWAGTLKLRVEEIAPNQIAATASFDALRTALLLFRTAENNLPSRATNPDWQNLLNSAEVHQRKDRTTFTADVPVSLLDKLLTAQDSLHALPSGRPQPAAP